MKTQELANKAQGLAKLNHYEALLAHTVNFSDTNAYEEMAPQEAANSRQVLAKAG